MSTFTLTIELGNDAMNTPEDVGGALRRVSEDLFDHKGVPSGTISDENGNTVGKWELGGTDPLAEAARELLDICDWPRRYDQEDYDRAVSALRDATPSKPAPPIDYDPANDPF